MTNRILLRAVVICVLSFGIVSVASAAIHAGFGTFSTGSVKINTKRASNQFTAVVLTSGENGVTETSVGQYPNAKQAQKAADKAARQQAKQELKDARQEARDANPSKLRKAWKKFKSLFRKNKDGVMLGPDGQGDMKTGGDFGGMFPWTNTKTGDQFLLPFDSLRNSDLEQMLKSAAAE